MTQRLPPFGALFQLVFEKGKFKKCWVWSHEWRKENTDGRYWYCHKCRNTVFNRYFEGSSNRFYIRNVIAGLLVVIASRIRKDSWT